MIFILFSLLINQNEMDSLKKIVHPKLIGKRAELLNEHPDYPKFFIPVPQKNEEREKKSTFFSRAQPETVRVAAIRVQFLRDSTSLTTGDGRMVLEGSGNICDTIIEDGDTSYVRSLYYDPPHDFTYFNRLMEYVHNYFWESSYHKLWIEWRVLPDSTDSVYTLPNKMTYYGEPENYVIGLYKLLRDAVEVADYDVDFSGIDEVIIFHAGSMYQSDYLYDSPYDLPAVSAHEMHRVFNTYLVADGDTIDSGIIYPETGFQDGLPAYLQGGLCHEFAHSETVGLLDLYDISGETMGMGGWALMGTGNWNELGLVPPRPCAYNRVKCCYDNPVIINRDTSNLQIKWAGSMDSTTPLVYKIPINKDEYYLIENRIAYINPDTHHYANPCTAKVDSNGFRVWKDNVLVKVDDYDSSLPPSLNDGGLAIWHIDEEKIASAESLNTINVGTPKGIDIEEADGIQDYEKSFWDVYNIDAVFYGSELDVFRDGGWLAEFTPSTDPETKDNSDNYSGIHIYNISEADTLMTFDVKFDRNVAGFPVEFKDKMDVISPQFYDSSVYIGDMFGGVYRTNPVDTLFRMIHQQDSIYVDSTYTTPLISDITGDGNMELVDMTIRGRVFLYDLTNDSILDTMRVTEAIYGNASAAELDNNPGKEILFGTSASELHVLRWNGSELTEVDGFPLYMGDWLVSTPLVIKKSIYCLPEHGILWKVSNEGELIWKAGEGNLPYSLSSPVAGDLDRDGIKEIICSAGNGEVFAVDTTGSIEWRINLDTKTYFSTPALGDITGDGYLEVVLADKKNLYSINRNGYLIDNFPVEINLSDETQSSIILSDVDGDSIPDILFGSPDGGVMGYDSRGEKIVQFPLTSGRRSYSTPLVADINNDGISELFIGSYDGWLYGWKTEGHYSTRGWNQIYRNNSHQCIFPDSLLEEKQEPGDVKLEEFYVYPSPVTEGIVNFRFVLGGEADDVSLKVYSLSGRLVAEKSVTGEYDINDVPLNISSQINGVYIAVIEINDSISEKKKFAVLRGG